MTDHSVHVLATSRGNDVVLEIARSLVAGFSHLGIGCELAIDRPPVAGSSGAYSLVVAPHEYFPLFLSPLLATRDLQLARAQVFVLNVEQPGSYWFEVAWTHARASRGVFDISRAGAREFRSRGVMAVHAPLGHSPAADPIPNIPLRERDMDIAFLGHNSSRRGAFFARHAALFSGRRCQLTLSDVSRPRHENTPGYVSGAARNRLLARARILLNVHSADRRYFESHRALLASASGCVLVTESSHDTEPLVPGRHFAMAELDALPALCERLLDNPEELEAISEAARSFTRTALRIEDTCRTLVDAMAASEIQTQEDEPDFKSLRHSVRGRLQAAQRARAAGHCDWTLSSNAAYTGSPTPAVSVVVTLYNYERFIGECLQRVLASDPVPGGFEVVVVDDDSADGSASKVEPLMQDAATPVLLVRKRSNTGLADARNVGLQQARGPHVFILDADNWIYPSCLVTLERSWSAKLAGVYPLIARFDDQTGEGLGLLSVHDWSLRDLVRTPYIDAMALLDRTTVLSVGGYSTELIEHGWFGWEDYDLWLKLGLAGHECRLVPQVLGAYRVHSRSMIHTTIQTSMGIARHFERKFVALVRRYPDVELRFGFPLHAGRPRANLESLSPDGLAARCAELESEVTALRESISWRLTAPLRAVFRWITGRPT